MKFKSGHTRRAFAALIALCLLAGSLVSCSQASEIPDGYQYATCDGEYFRLFVPTQWTVNTDSGVSSAYVSLNTESMVSMAEVLYHPGDTAAETADAANTADRTATLADLVDSHMAEIAKMKAYTSEKSFDSTLSGYRAKDITYTAEVGGKTYRFRQVLTSVEGRFYLFTYSSLADSFDLWLDAVDGILENILFYSTPYEGDHERKIPEDKNTPDGMKLVSTNEVAYRFYAPTDWILDVTNDNNLVYASEADRSNVSMMAYMPESDAFSVADYWELCNKHYADALEDYVLCGEPVEETMGGRNATVYEYTHTLGGVSYKTRQVVTVYSTMVYTMTYTALPEQYELHLEEAKAMQAALTFRSWGN